MVQIASSLLEPSVGDGIEVMADSYLSETLPSDLTVRQNDASIFSCKERLLALAAFFCHRPSNVTQGFVSKIISEIPSSMILVDRP